MTEDHIRYDILAQDALRGVVRNVLNDVAKTGLPGEHHFFISFDTRHPGVKISARLREQYPQDMTIVLQHQFWDLIVSDEGFEVGLSFNHVPERLVIPFAALKGFFDPSVQFGLQFNVIEAENSDDEEEAGYQDNQASEKTAELEESAEVTPLNTHAKKKAAGKSAKLAAAKNPEVEVADAEPTESKKSRKKDVAPEDGDEDPAGEDDTPATATVVSLDTFRKKK